MTLMVLKDGSVVDETGKVIFFSTERFKTDICLGNCCFICGAQPGSVPFNDEHVIPDWILRRYDLHAMRITLPNGESIRYDQYKVPCCEACNSLMGREIEDPISEIIRGGVASVANYVKENGSLKIFVWLGLIFLKTHLKDRTFRRHLDERKGRELIADDYDWEHLHHIHTVVRCFYVGSHIEPEVLGSFMMFQARKHLAEETFDFADLYLAQTMLLRLGDVAFIAVFDDSQAAMTKFFPRTKTIDGPLTELQLREVMTELAWLNLLLKERPRF